MPRTGRRTWKCHRPASTSNGWTSGCNAGTKGSTRRDGTTSSVIVELTTNATTVVDRVQVQMILVGIAKLFGRKRLVGLMLKGIVKMIRSGRCHHSNTTKSTVRTLVGFAVASTSVATCTDNGILASWRIG